MDYLSADSIDRITTRFSAEGYVVVPGLFNPSETAQLTEHFMRLRAEGPKPGDFPEPVPGDPDPLKRYPRMIHMHRWDAVSLRWLLDPRLKNVLTALLSREPFAVQTMLYFKPPGARGQALHQDQFYVKVQPGTCIAAWMALDDCDEENGCMQVVPHSHTLPTLCTKKADLCESFTDVTVPIPPAQRALPIPMQAGGILFLNGHLIHGSYPNRSETRFRRALIGHYIDGNAQSVAAYYHPALRFDGSTIELRKSDGGGPCGVWVERADGHVALEMVAGRVTGAADHAP
jgi:hypothetical protein